MIGMNYNSTDLVKPLNDHCNVDREFATDSYAHVMWEIIT